jgi:hypothetical protein
MFEAALTTRRLVRSETRSPMNLLDLLQIAPNADNLCDYRASSSSPCIWCRGPLGFPAEAHGSLRLKSCVFWAKHSGSLGCGGFRTSGLANDGSGRSSTPSFYYVYSPEESVRGFDHNAENELGKISIQEFVVNRYSSFLRNASQCFRDETLELMCA